MHCTSSSEGDWHRTTNYKKKSLKHFHKFNESPRNNGETTEDLNLLLNLLNPSLD